MHVPRCKNSGEKQFLHDLIIFQVAKSTDPNPVAECDLFSQQALSFNQKSPALPFAPFAYERDCLVHENEFYL